DTLSPHTRSFFFMIPRTPPPPLFPYTTLFRSAGPDRRVVVPYRGHAGVRGRHPNVCRGVVSPTRIKRVRRKAVTTPDNHLAAGPDRHVPVPCGGCTDVRGRHPNVCHRVVSRTRISNGDAVAATPDNHLAAGPDRRVPAPFGGRGGGGRRRPVSYCGRFGRRGTNRAGRHGAAAHHHHASAD